MSTVKMMNVLEMKESLLDYMSTITHHFYPECFEWTDEEIEKCWHSRKRKDNYNSELIVREYLNNALQDEYSYHVWNTVTSCVRGWYSEYKKLLCEYFELEPKRRYDDEVIERIVSDYAEMLEPEVKIKVHDGNLFDEDIPCVLSFEGELDLPGLEYEKENNTGGTKEICFLVNIPIKSIFSRKFVVHVGTPFGFYDQYAGSGSCFKMCTVKELTADVEKGWYLKPCCCFAGYKIAEIFGNHLQFGYADATESGW